MERSYCLSVRKFHFRNHWSNCDKCAIGGYSKGCSFDFMPGMRPCLVWEMGSSVTEKPASSIFKESALP
jgi:hypothetical protein